MTHVDIPSVSLQKLLSAWANSLTISVRGNTAGRPVASGAVCVEGEERESLRWFFSSSTYLQQWPPRCSAVESLRETVGRETQRDAQDASHTVRQLRRPFQKTVSLISFKLNSNQQIFKKRITVWDEWCYLYIDMSTKHVVSGSWYMFIHCTSMSGGGDEAAEPETSDPDCVGTPEYS